MRLSWRLGRVAGIDLFLHPTFLLLFFLPAVYRGGLEAIALVLSVFGCVLLHELGHALMARRFGIRTEDITLYPIGGVARLQRMPKSPGAELLVALAGPAVNVLIIVALGAVLLAGESVNLWAAFPVADFLATLMAANLLLAAFNLIPAFPMDGGRVLRALLSGWMGRARATTIAAGLGRLLALLFGIYSLVYGQWTQVFLAMFIYLAAGAELSRVLAEERRREIGSGGIWTAPPGFRWVSRGNGIWQLAPIVVTVQARDRTTPTWL